ncbi:S-adenosyl-L-methionine-dependent methyltransferase [Mycena amicta]|nr:S-adenosyl-L-methionine-dependent methyltransferase [Mycena amicta]
MDKERVYRFQSAEESAVEAERLDEQHQAMTRYLGGRLSLAPLEQIQPRTILELGCGSGAWAIQAACEFPDAQVTAVDISPFLERSIPENMAFLQMDLSKHIPLQPGSFDVVHARFVLSHLAEPHKPISRIAELVSPGGFLIFEDYDAESVIRTSSAGTRRFMERIQQVFSAKNQDFGLGRHLPEIMSDLDGFHSAVNTRREEQLLGLNAAQAASNPFSMEMRSLFLKATKQMGLLLDYDEDVIAEHLKEFNTPGYTGVLDIYFCWVQRKGLTLKGESEV